MIEASKLKRWQSHKIVHAGKIVSITEVIGDAVGDGKIGPTETNTELAIETADGAVESVIPEPKMFARYTPVVGDYYVVYDDGYASISPAKAFEEGYSPAD